MRITPNKLLFSFVFIEVMKTRLHFGDNFKKKCKLPGISF